MQSEKAVLAWLFSKYSVDSILNIGIECNHVPKIAVTNQRKFALIANASHDLTTEEIVTVVELLEGACPKFLFGLWKRENYSEVTILCPPTDICFNCDA